MSSQDQDGASANQPDRGDGPNLVVRPSWGRRLVGIEGLRGLAALSVLFHHVGQHLTDPQQTGPLDRAAVLATHGLTLFFAISGFLLFRPFAAAMVNGDRLPAIGAYASNRFLRIYPAYVVIFVLVSFVFGAAYTTGVSGVAGPASIGPSIGYVTNPVTIAIDLLLVQTYVPGFLFTGVGTAWSLTAEIAFYVVMPLLAMAAMSMIRRRVSPSIAVLLPAIVLIVIGWVTTALIAGQKAGLGTEAADQYSWGQSWTAVLDRSLLSQADLFGYGMAAAIVVVLLRKQGVISLPGWLKGALLLGSILGLLGATSGLLGAFAVNGVGVACGLLILATVLPSSRPGSTGNAIARVLEWLPLRYLGLISYSIYLWHLPVIWWLRVHQLTFGADAGGFLLNLVLVIAVTVPLSSATYFLVERPAMRYKRFSRQPVPVAGAANELAAERAT